LEQQLAVALEEGLAGALVAVSEEELAVALEEGLAAAAAWVAELAVGLVLQSECHYHWALEMVVVDFCSETQTVLARRTAHSRAPDFYWALTRAQHSYWENHLAQKKYWVAA
jgi:hypothetical protein